MYPRLIRPEWRSLDLIRNAERTIHQIVRQRQKGARPPVLQCLRVSPREVRLTYESRRNLCALATGIMRGVASHYGESVAIAQAACVLRGDHAYVFSNVARAASQPGEEPLVSLRGPAARG